MSLLPKLPEIKNWSDERVKDVYSLLFEENVSPKMKGDTQEDVDEYMQNVESEYNIRFKKDLYHNPSFEDINEW